jgi:hypothetical protein
VALEARDQRRPDDRVRVAGQHQRRHLQAAIAPGTALATSVRLGCTAN